MCSHLMKVLLLFFLIFCLRLGAAENERFFFTDEIDGTSKVFSYTPSAKQPVRRVTSGPGHETGVVTDTDSKRIAFLRSSDTDSRLILLDILSKKETVVEDGLTSAGLYTFDENNSSFFYVMDNDGVQSVWQYDDGQKKKITDLGKNISYLIVVIERNIGIIGGYRFGYSHRASLMSLADGTEFIDLPLPVSAGILPSNLCIPPNSNQIVFHRKESNLEVFNGVEFDESQPDQYSFTGISVISLQPLPNGQCLVNGRINGGKLLFTLGTSKEGTMQTTFLTALE